MTSAARALGRVVAMLACIWGVAALAVALLLRGQHVERNARYVDVDTARSFAVQGSPEFVALQGGVAGSALALRRGHDSDATWYLPMHAAQAASSEEVHWIVRYEGTALPAPDGPILGRHAAHALPRVVRDEFQRVEVRLASDAAVVDWIPSRQRVVLDRDADTLSFGVAIAGFVSAICVLGCGMLGMASDHPQPDGCAEHSSGEHLRLRVGAPRSQGSQNCASTGAAKWNNARSSATASSNCPISRVSLRRE